MGHVVTTRSETDEGVVVGEKVPAGHAVQTRSAVAVAVAEK
jgi:hypothetical protein